MAKLLKQNNLSESTTGLDFVKTINENAGKTIVQLERNVELDDGSTVKVENITPSKMKSILNNLIENPETNGISFKTPGENYSDTINGVVQMYNKSTEEKSIEHSDDSKKNNNDEPSSNPNEDSTESEDTSINN